MIIFVIVIAHWYEELAMYSNFTPFIFFVGTGLVGWLMVRLIWRIEDGGRKK